MSLAFVTALQLEHRQLFGYVFRGEEYPWLMSWMNYPETSGRRAAWSSPLSPLTSLLSGGRLIIEDRKAGERIELAASLPL